MREILFRGKVLESEAVRYSGQSPKWAIGNLHKDPSGYDCSISDYDTCSSFYVDPETVCQFTGMRDRKGKMIFEGDILRYMYENSENSYDPFIKMYPVVWKDGCFKYNDEYLDVIVNDPDGYEVMGNIHDNPELLEASDENN